MQVIDTIAGFRKALDEDRKRRKKENLNATHATSGATRPSPPKRARPTSSRRPSTRCTRSVSRP